MIIGVVPWADLGVQRIPTHYWWFPEMTASFLLAILIGLGRAQLETNFVESFVNGARDLLGVALIIGIARGVTVIMTNGHHRSSTPPSRRSGLGGVAFINLMFGLFLLSFLIPSSSGLATVAMPIMPRWRASRTSRPNSWSPRTRPATAW